MSLSTAFIAVLDDSRFVLAHTKATLERAGFTVRCFEEAGELDPRALAGASLVLVDANMREMFGDDVISYLKRELGVSVPVLLYSSVAEAELSLRAHAAGADGYVLKAGDVVDQVRRALGSSHV